MYFEVVLLENNIFWEQLRRSLYKYVKKYIHDDNDVEDILQDVLLKILNNIDCLKDYNKIDTWIYKICKNTIIDFYRSKNKEIVQITEDLYEEDVDECSFNKEISKCVNTMIENLPDMYKEVLKLIEYKGLSQREVSQQLGISVSAVKSRVYRARIMIKKMLLECCYLEVDKLGNVIDYKHKNINCKFC